jgi:hypothetical protein
LNKKGKTILSATSGDNAINLFQNRRIAARPTPAPPYNKKATRSGRFFSKSKQ